MSLSSAECHILPHQTNMYHCLWNHGLMKVGICFLTSGKNTASELLALWYLSCLNQKGKSCLFCDTFFNHLLRYHAYHIIMFQQFWTLWRYPRPAERYVSNCLRSRSISLDRIREATTSTMWRNGLCWSQTCFSVYWWSWSWCHWKPCLGMWMSIQSSCLRNHHPCLTISAWWMCTCWQCKVLITQISGFRCHEAAGESFRGQSWEKHQ